MRHPATLQATTKSCSDENCPSMTGGPKYIYCENCREISLTGVMFRYEYLWQDEVRHKKAVQMTAPEYILTLLEWASDIITVQYSTVQYSTVQYSVVQHST